MRKTDACIILSEDGKISMKIPKIDPVPFHVLRMTALGVLLSEDDKKLNRLINKKIKEFYTKQVQIEKE